MTARNDLETVEIEATVLVSAEREMVERDGPIAAAAYELGPRAEVVEALAGA